VLRFKAHRFQLKCNETLQVAVIEEEIEFEILIIHLHANLFADEGEAVAQFHEKLAQVGEKSGLQIGFAVPLRKIKEMEEIAALENAGRVLGAKLASRCESFVRKHSSLEDVGRTRACNLKLLLSP
jgi:hypothetical protein